MTLNVEAICVDGQLRLKQSLALADGTTVRVAITPVDDVVDPLDAVIGICEGGPPDGAEKHDEYIYGKIRP